MSKEEGDKCDCGGTFEFYVADGCSCHITPPCSVCVEAPLKCNNCGALPEESE